MRDEGGEGVGLFVCGKRSAATGVRACRLFRVSSLYSALFCMLCSAMLCFAMLCYPILCYPIPCSNLPPMVVVVVVAV